VLSGMTFILIATSPILGTSRTGEPAHLAGVRVALFLASVASGYYGAAAGTGKLDSAYTGNHHATRYALFGYFFLHVSPSWLRYHMV
jgi:hypothetical protein